MPKNNPQHTVLKIYLIVSLIILILNAGLLALIFIPLIGAYMFLTAEPIFFVTGVLGLANLFIVSRSLSKKYLSGGFRKVAVTVKDLSIVAVLNSAYWLYSEIAVNFGLA